jgi:hypothetical protein
MHTIASHASDIATVLAVRHVGYVRLLAARPARNPVTGSSALVIVLFVTFIAAIGSAIRRLAGLMSELLSMAAAAMSVAAALVVALALAAVLLIRL